MIKKYFEYIVLVLLAIVVLQGLFSTPNGITPEEELYRLKIHDLTQEKIILINENDSLNNKLDKLKNNYHEVDSITADYNNMQVDSFFSNFFAR